MKQLSTMAIRFANMRQLVFVPKKNLLVIAGSITFFALIIAAISSLNMKSVDDSYDEVIDNYRDLDGDKLPKDSSKIPPHLKPYPSELQSAARDLAESRNPFAAPTALGSAQGIPGPLISIKGFARSKDESKPTVFLSVNQSQDLIYQIGQEVGNGYRIVSIEPSKKLVIISDGINRLDYVFKEF